MADEVVERDEAGRWITPPKSPGRPVGPSHADLVRAVIEPHYREILDKAIELAKLGDPQAMKICLERFAPTPRPEAEKVIVPGLRDAPTLKGKALAIVHAAASGQISAEAADRLLTMLNTYARAVEVDDGLKQLKEMKSGKLAAPSADAPGADLV